MINSNFCEYQPGSTLGDFFFPRSISSRKTVKDELKLNGSVLIISFITLHFCFSYPFYFIFLPGHSWKILVLLSWSGKCLVKDLSLLFFYIINYPARYGTRKFILQMSSDMYFDCFGVSGNDHFCTIILLFMKNILLKPWWCNIYRPNSFVFLHLENEIWRSGRLCSPTCFIIMLFCHTFYLYHKEIWILHFVILKFRSFFV